MALQPVNIESFGGLDLASDPEEVGWNAAIDLLNIDLARTGRIRTRSGSVVFTASAAATAYQRLFRVPGSAPRILAARPLVLAAIDSGGSVLTTQATTTTIWSVAHIGTPTATYTYFANGADQVRRWDGSAFSSPAGLSTYTPYYLAAQQTDNRLVMGMFPSQRSRVYFSDPGAPETIGANNYVDLRPGDGSDICGLVSYDSLVFVFKNGAYFVFYGNSTDSTGNPVFNYRAIDVDIGIAGNHAVTSGPGGVYFLGDDFRLYRTTGGPPAMVSDGLVPAFQATMSAFAQVISPDNVWSTRYVDGRVIITVALSNVPKQFVYDVAGDYWLYWDIPAYDFAAGVHTTDSVTERYPLYFASTSTNDVCRVDRQATTDAGSVAIVSRYRSGFSDVGLPGREKTVRQTELVGQGSPTFGWSRDFGAITSTSSQAVTLGTAPATARALHRLSQNGELLSWQASASSGAWQLNRITPMLRLPRQPGDKTA